jgi:S-adenosylmethionine:tRNA ribosyltransferase-isomerase
MHPKELRIEDFTYELPQERIAQFPLEERHNSKLLLYKGGEISHTSFENLVDRLPEKALLVFNNSKVVEARLLFQKPTGGIIEIFALEPHEQYADITVAMATTGSILYKCLVGGASKWKSGVVLHKEVAVTTGTIRVEAIVKERRPDCFVIELSWTPGNLSFAAILHAVGNIPIPPYLNRAANDSDTERYQTIYAKADGSVAAPTAGLHFTPQVLAALVCKNIQQAYATLHVGAGTFMPVKSATMQDHPMHAEFIDVTIEFIQQLIDTEIVIPVGTTSMRTIESLYWMGVKANADRQISIDDLTIKQWDVYDSLEVKAVDKITALNALISWLKNNKSERLIIKTQIIIAPGYRFRIAKGLITNFHQPQSTLLLLVSALVGEDWRKIYAYAMENDFRFLSYGDSSYLVPSPTS